jgi:hypothetical protein
MRKVLFFTISIISLFLGSCSNDLEINAPWKDVTVVFGLLNVDSSTHYIRISKAFLGEGDALEFASQFDSIYYNPDLLNVKVYRVYNGLVKDSFLCSAVTDIAKDPGIFSNPSQIIYSFNASLTGTEKENSIYRLEVKNTKTGNVATAETELVKPVAFSKPNSFNPNVPASALIDLDPTKSTAIEWRTVENGKMYELFLRFKYREFNFLDSSYIGSKVVEINLGRNTYDNSSVGDLKRISIENASIFQAIHATIPVQSSVFRRADSLQFQINVAADDMTTYLNINQPSNTVAQERPQYTNVTNGIGLFSSRNSKTRSKYINDETIVYLRADPLTRDLNWADR